VVRFAGPFCDEQASVAQAQKLGLFVTTHELEFALPMLKALGKELKRARERGRFAVWGRRFSQDFEVSKLDLSTPVTDPRFAMVRTILLEFSVTLVA